MTFRARKASWFVSGLVLVIVVSAGVKLVLAQPKTETSRPTLGSSEATFEALGEQFVININNVAYTSDGGTVFDIYFACSSARAPDPLRFTDAKDIQNARSYFDDESRYRKHLVKVGQYRISARNIAFIESKGESVVVNFNTRIVDSFVHLNLLGADAETFRKEMREFRL